MYSLEYEILSKAPIIIGNNDSGSNMIHSLGYISGSSILGMFANNYIKKKGINNPQNDSLFSSWFLNGDLQFANAYLSTFNNFKKIIFKPTPLYIHKNKDNDYIFNSFLKELKESKPIRGFSYIQKVDDEHYNIEFCDDIKNLYFHHKRSNRIKVHSDDGGIFCYESIPKGKTFYGNIFGTKDQLEKFKDYFKDFTIAWIGKSKNAQYGQISLSLKNIKYRNMKEYLKKCLEDSNLENNEFIITLESQAILLNSFGYYEPSTLNLKNYLEKYLECELEIDKCFVAVEPVERFVSVWKMKKPIVMALSAGSTFKVKLLDNITKTTQQRLISFLEEGIGECRNEGFGRIKLETNLPNYYEHKVINMNYDKPKEQPSEILKEKLIDIIKDKVKERINNEAFLLVNEFRNRPTNHILGRLEGILLKDPNNFSKIVDKLSEIAKSNLKKCNNKIITLFDFIKVYKVTKTLIEDFLIKTEYIKIQDDFKFDLSGDEEFKEMLYIEFWVTFLGRMRKLNKLEGKNE